MRRAFAVATVLAAFGCKQQQPPQAAITVVEWAQASPDGRFEIRQRREGTGCRVQAVVRSSDGGDRSLWSTQTCLPTPSGLVFLSANGEKLLVLDLFPSGQTVQTSDWSQLPLISLWVRGAVVRQYTGTDVLGEAQAADMKRVLSWVRGDTYEDAHKSARPSADGERISVDLVDGRTLTLDFEGNPLPAAPTRPAARHEETATAEPPPAQPGRPSRADQVPAADDRAGTPADQIAADEQGVYRWEDDQGELHFGAGAQVPAKYRKRARPVDATVGVVPLERPTILGPSQPAAGAAGQPAAGAPAQPGGSQPAPAAPQPPPSAEPVPPPPGTR